MAMAVSASDASMGKSDAFLGYHHIACGATGRRHARHDALVRIIAAAVRGLCGSSHVPGPAA